MLENGRGASLDAARNTLRALPGGFRNSKLREMAGSFRVRARVGRLLHGRE
jgi:hypothetical protein